MPFHRIDRRLLFIVVVAFTVGKGRHEAKEDVREPVEPDAVKEGVVSSSFRVLLLVLLLLLLLVRSMLAIDSVLFMLLR